MKAKLILLDNPVIVTGEEIKEGEKYLDDTNLIRTSVMDNQDYWSARKGYQKIISHNKPIDYNGIDFGIVDIEYDYDELGKQMVNDAVLAFEKKHGYSILTKEQRDKKFKEMGVGGDYLEFNYYDEDEDSVSLWYAEKTPHDCPYSVEVVVPKNSLVYPKKASQQLSENKFSEADMMDAIEYGFKYFRDSQNNGIDVPKGNKLQWLLNRKSLPKTFEVEIEETPTNIKILKKL